MFGSKISVCPPQAKKVLPFGSKIMKFEQFAASESGVGSRNQVLAKLVPTPGPEQVLAWANTRHRGLVSPLYWGCFPPVFCSCIFICIKGVFLKYGLTYIHGRHYTVMFVHDCVSYLYRARIVRNTPTARAIRLGYARKYALAYTERRCTSLGSACATGTRAYASLIQTEYNRKTASSIRSLIRTRIRTVYTSQIHVPRYALRPCNT